MHFNVILRISNDLSKYNILDKTGKNKQTMMRYPTIINRNSFLMAVTSLALTNWYVFT